MKPVVIIQQDELLGPGHLLPGLQALGLPAMVLRPDLGQCLPMQASEVGGLILLGCEDDALAPPWLPALQRLGACALSEGVPVLGLGSGAQLLAVLAGGRSHARSSPYLGWSQSLLSPEAALRFSCARLQSVFMRTTRNLELPPQARGLVFDRRCVQQGFALGPHLGLLCHAELDAAGVRELCARTERAVPVRRGPDVQQRSELLRALPDRAAAQHRLLDGVLRDWSLALRRDTPPLHRHKAAALPPFLGARHGLALLGAGV